MLNIYKASAGSGKTFTLAREYIKMVLGVEDNGTGRWHLNPVLLAGRHSIGHRHILAITFTNKATEEMKVRIIGNLDGLSRIKTVKGHPYARDLVGIFGCTPDELALAARNAMTSLLLDFSFFNVSTIDSFFQSVMRTFARELDIQGDYNITIDSEGAVRDAFNSLLDALNSTGKTNPGTVEHRVQKWLADFVDINADAGEGNRFSPFQRGTKIYNDQIKIVKAIFTEHFKPLQHELRAYLDNPANLERLAECLARIKKEQEKIILTASDVVADRIRAAGFSPSKFFADAIEKVRTGVFFELLGADRFKDIPISFRLVLEGGVNETVYPKYIKGLKNIPSDIDRAMSGWADTLLPALTVWQTAGIIEDNIPQLEFIGLMLTFLDRLREQNNMLILDDTSSYIKRIIGGSSIPFIYEHIGTRLSNFLIDEFQDTSRLQWENIRPLVRNSADTNDDSLIIGDTKQAIYRFRNSDSTILSHTLVAEDFPNPTTRTVRGDNPKDNTNWRTAHPIVHLNNAVIPVLASEAFGTTAYVAGYGPADVVQECADKTLPLPSRVKFIPFDGTADKSGPAGPELPAPLGADELLGLTVPLDKATRIGHIVAQIKAQHARGHRWGDIAILTRWNKTSEPIVKALLDNDIPVQSVESLYIRNAPSVRLILGILSLIARAGAPDAPINQRSSENPKTRDEARMEQALFEARYDYFVHAGGCDPARAISLALDPRADDGAPVDADINASVQTILAEHPATIVATIESIIEKGLVHQATVEIERDYVAAFEDVAVQYSEEYDNDLNGFLDWWATHGDRCTVPPPPHTDAVNIMTVHKSKGLEFRCVHLVDFEWALTSDKEKIWLDVRAGTPTNTYGIDLGLGIDKLLPPLILYKIRTDMSHHCRSPFVPVHTEQVEKMRFDAVNTAYVALTRPVEELTVYFHAPDPDTPGAAGNVADALVRSLRRLADALPTGGTGNVPDITDSTFNRATGALAFDHPGTEYADNDGPGPGDIDTKAVYDSADFLDIDYLGKYRSTSRSDVHSLVRVDSIAGGIDIEDTDPDSPDEPEAPRDDSQRRRGVDLHNILSGIITPGDIDKAVGAASRIYGYDEGATDVYVATIMRALTPDIAGRWFNPSDDITTEVSFFVPTDNDDPDDMGFIRRIDRLVVRPDGTADIVDYKFTTEETDRHRRQVAGYVRYVRRMLPGVRVTGYLWYIDLDKVVRVQ